MRKHLILALYRVLLGKASHELLVLFGEAFGTPFLLLLESELERAQVLPGQLKAFPIQVHAESLDASVVNVVALVENHDAVLLELGGDEIGDLRVEQVVVVVDDDVRADQESTRQEIRAHVRLLAQLLEIVKCEDAFGKPERVGSLLEVVIEAAPFYIVLTQILYVHGCLGAFGLLLLGRFLGFLLLLGGSRSIVRGLLSGWGDPLSCPSPTHAINFLSIVFFRHFLVNAEVPAAGQAQGADRRAQLLGPDLATEIGLSRLLDELQLVKRLLHLDDCASAVD